ncbi:MAG: hypothetical protein A3J40_01345 [Erythrobacter sp. RIFCSPHIGHO2_12_FULL_63_10]|nr:MAG: hypothetical protein A3J40_01345 [Erythrobacter sp. RIFCSPHIGHO2_12_FULL_63_10]
MREMLLLIPMLGLAACISTGEAPPSGEPAPKPAASGQCSADNTREFVRQIATAQLGAAIRARTGAQIFQWVPPRTAVTMDYRQDRVRVSYDDDMRIVRIACG